MKRLRLNQSARLGLGTEPCLPKLWSPSVRQGVLASALGILFALSGCFSFGPEAEQAIGVIGPPTEAERILIPSGTEPLVLIGGALLVQRLEGTEPEQYKAEISCSGSMLDSVLTPLLQRFRANTSVPAELDGSMAGALAGGMVCAPSSRRQAPGRDEFTRLLLPDHLDDAGLRVIAATRRSSHLVLAAVFVGHSPTVSHSGAAGGGRAGAPLFGIEHPIDFEVNAAVYEVATGVPVARLQWTERDANVTVWTLLPLPVAGVTVDQQRYLRGMGAIVGQEIGRRFGVR